MYTKQPRNQRNLENCHQACFLGDPFLTEEIWVIPWWDPEMVFYVLTRSNIGMDQNPMICKFGGGTHKNHQLFDPLSGFRPIPTWSLQNLKERFYLILWHMAQKNMAKPGFGQRAPPVVLSQPGRARHLHRPPLEALEALEAWKRWSWHG